MLDNHHQLHIYLGGHAHRPLHLEALLLGTPDQISAHCKIATDSRQRNRTFQQYPIQIGTMAQNSVLNKSQSIILQRSSSSPKVKNDKDRNTHVLTLLKRLDIAAGEGDADAVNGHLRLNWSFATVFECLQVLKGEKKVNF